MQSDDKEKVLNSIDELSDIIYDNIGKFLDMHEVDADNKFELQFLLKDFAEELFFDIKEKIEKL